MIRLLLGKIRNWILPLVCKRTNVGTCHAPKLFQSLNQKCWSLQVFIFRLAKILKPVFSCCQLTHSIWNFRLKSKNKFVSLTHRCQKHRSYRLQDHKRALRHRRNYGQWCTIAYFHAYERSTSSTVESTHGNTTQALEDGFSMHNTALLAAINAVEMPALRFGFVWNRQWN